MHVFFFACYLKNLPNNRRLEYLAYMYMMATKHALHYSWRLTAAICVRTSHAHQLIHLEFDAVYTCKCSANYKPLFASCGDRSAIIYKPDVYNIHGTYVRNVQLIGLLIVVVVIW